MAVTNFFTAMLKKMETKFNQKVQEENKIDHQDTIILIFKV